MEWNKHIETLKKFSNEFCNETTNFDKYTNIYNFIKKFSKINNYDVIIYNHTIDLNFHLNQINKNENIFKSTDVNLFKCLFDKKIKKYTLIKLIF